jgi:preprotein translocase subunit SecB
VTRGGFPQLLLQPINFDALYAQAMRERAQGGNGGQQSAELQGGPAGESH